MQQRRVRRISAIGFLCLLAWGPSAIRAQTATWEVPLRIAERPESGTSTPLLDPDICVLCNNAIPCRTLENLTAPVAEEAAEAISRWNIEVIVRADSLLRSGAFGVPESEEARGEAIRYFKYHALSALEFIGYLANHPRVVWETNQRGVEGFFADFANPGIYPIWGLTRARMGGDMFCMEFDVAERTDARRMMGLRQVRLRSTHLKRDGRKAPAWSMELPTPSSGEAHYVFCDRYSGRVRREIIEEQGQELELVILEGLDGFYIKKWGTHQCAALVLWRNRLPIGQWPPALPRLGAVAYFPGLRLRLPGFLPDVNLSDLRSFRPFQPLIAADACREGRLPEWVPVSDEGTIGDWEGEGPIPEAICEWFPDL